ncbi:MAG: RNA polymerase sigma factor [Thermomicrobiales bacterium]
MLRVRVGSDAPDAMWSNQDDLTLAVAAKTDRAACGVLYDRYVDRVYGYCYRRLQTPEVAEDATSQVFIKALVALPRFRDDGPSFGAWLFAIAHNVVIDEFRAARRAPWPAATAVTVDDAPGPEETAVAAEGVRELRAVLSQLSADQANVIELRLAGLTDKEIAFVLGRGHGAIRVIQHRAVRRLRALLGVEQQSKVDRDA